METKKEPRKLNPDSDVYDTGVTCRIPSCGGTVLADLGYPSVAGERRIGPGSRQPKKVIGLRCSMCQIQYAHVPGPQGPDLERVHKINRDLDSNMRCGEFTQELMDLAAAHAKQKESPQSSPAPTILIDPAFLSKGELPPPLASYRMPEGMDESHIEEAIRTMDKRGVRAPEDQDVEEEPPLVEGNDCGERHGKTL